MLAEAAAAGSRPWRLSWNSCSHRNSRSKKLVARWRGLRRDADVLREHASANLLAAERLERAVATLKEKEQRVPAGPLRTRSRTICAVCSSSAGRPKHWRRGAGSR